jgi:hypothetical protein
METAGYVKRYIKHHNVELEAIDTVGVGGGVYDRLAEEGEPVFAMIASSRPRDYVTFANSRAEWYWNLRETLERGELDIDDNDEDLVSELASLQFKIDSRGRIIIESKEDMRKRGMTSPDLADAVVLSFGAPAHMDWNAAYGIITCLGCGKGFLEEGRTACPHCSKRID